MKKFILFTTLFLLFGTAIAVPNSDTQAQSSLELSPDAIAVRIMSNDNYYSPLRWYDENIAQKGSPSELLVDGYQAVRDGRSVYVNAANIQDDFQTMYVNMYILSYTQDANSETIDIFGQLLENWSFNNNITNTQTDFVGQCIRIENNNPTDDKCFEDYDCGRGSGLYCSSLKAKITRDVRRLADLRDIEDALNDYNGRFNADPGCCINKNTNQATDTFTPCYKDETCSIIGANIICSYIPNYPSLSAGSYLANKTISVWPSWQETLGQVLGISMPVDPLNKLIGCNESEGYDEDTCWNDELRTLSTAVQIPSNISGRVYSYLYKEDNTYNLCAIMESGLTTKLASDSACPNSVRIIVEASANIPPIIHAPTSVNVEINKPFDMYFYAYDPDGYIAGWGSVGIPVDSIKPAGSQYYKITTSIDKVGESKIMIGAVDNSGAKTERTFSIAVTAQPTTPVMPTGGSEPVILNININTIEDIPDVIIENYIINPLP